MKLEVKVLLLGFTPFEKSTFESFFKLVGRRETLYKVVPDVGQAHVLLVNGDNPTAVQWAKASVTPPQKAMYIGAPDPLGKWPTAPRPIRLTTVLGLLDVLVQPDAAPFELAKVEPKLESSGAMRRTPAATAPSDPMAQTPVITPVRKNTVREGPGGTGNSHFAASNFMGLTAPEPQAKAEQLDEILVVDDSDVALKFMQNRLTRYGFRAELAKSGEEALTRVSACSYKFVFLDVMMEGLDGYQTCRAIKQRKYASGRSPVVVMLTSRGGSIDKIRGGLAGCDAYLTKPLNEVELLKVLSKYDEQVERSFRDTNMGGSGVSSTRSR
jgi:CheY-like chemotaxis protein